MATRIAFIKATPLTNVRGRVKYISDPKKQENLLAFTQTTADPNFWRDLAVASQRGAKYNKGKAAIEAREHIIQLPGDLRHGDHQAFAEDLARRFKEEYDVECAVAIHLNKSKKSYHAHLVFSERQLLLDEEQLRTATRNTYFDADGKRSDKHKCVGSDGELLPGCSLVKKGEAFPQRKFAGKDSKFFTRDFMRSEKQRYADYFSEISRDKWIVYDHKTNPHFAYLDLKRGEPEALRAWKERENQIRYSYNVAVDMLMKYGELTKEQAIIMKEHFYAAQKEEKERKQQERIEWQKQWEQHRAEKEKEYALQHWVYYDEHGHRRDSFEMMFLAYITLFSVICLPREQSERFLSFLSSYGEDYEGDEDYGLDELDSDDAYKVVRFIPDESILIRTEAMYQAIGKTCPYSYLWREERDDRPEFYYWEDDDLGFEEIEDVPKSKPELTGIDAVIAVAQKQSEEQMRDRARKNERTVRKRTDDIEL